MLRAALFTGLLLAGLATAPAVAAPAKHPCIVAGDDCAASISDVAGCRAAQATCLAMAAASAAGSSTDKSLPAELPEEPPLSPKDEEPGDALHPVAERCRAQAQEVLVTLLGGEIGRVSITKSPRWSLIWRADVSTPLEGGGRYLQRVVCVEGAFFLSPAKVVGQDVPPLP